MRMLKRYLKVEFYRLFHSTQFYIAAAGVFIVYMISSLQSVGSPNVFDLYYFIKFFSLIIVLFGCSNFAYANSLLEDWEHGFYQSILLRGNLKAYVCARSICCFFASMFSVIMGTLCFVFVQSCRLPLADPEADYGITPIVRQQDMFGWFLRKNWMMVYFFLSAMIIGCLAGILALSAMWLSLIAKNKMFSVCIPIASYYFLVNCIDEDILAINGMFLFSGNVLSNPLLSFCYTLLVTVGGAVFFSLLIYRRMSRMVRGVKK